MLPEGAEACSDPGCVHSRIGNCNKHSHKPWKPKPFYGGSHHTQNTLTPTMLAHGGCPPAHIYQTQGGVPTSGMAAPMTPSHGSQGLLPSSLAPSKVPSVAEEAEGPGSGPLDDTEQDCAGAARRLTQVMNWMRDNGHMGAMLRDFAHSDSCNVPACSPFCRMFRRVRRHVQGAQHPCMLLRTYAVLLRLHVHACNDDACGMRACPTLRNRHLMQNTNNQQHIDSLKQEDNVFDVDLPEH